VTEQKDGLSDPFSIRLEADQLDFIKDLEKRRILGRNQSAVIRALISYAMQDMAKNDFIQKHLAMRESARKG